ncbi:MAG: amino acid carrier protein [Deltaproteobacteria bacterium]
MGSAEVPLIVAWLIAAGLFFTVYLGLLNFRGIPEALRIVTGRKSGPGQSGEISAWAALSTACSGTVGIGNIGGVAMAITLGGPGATFWMIVAGLLGMATKCAECVLGVRYRHLAADGEVSGGPMHYLRAGFAERGWPGTGRVLGTFYAAAMVVGCLGIGNMFQSNQAFEQLLAATGGPDGPLGPHALTVGTLLALAVGVVIIGGIKSIAQVTTRLVPFMAAFYCLGCLVVIGLNADRLPAALAAIWTGAFSPGGISGGVMGVMVIGFQRAAFSNEAGLGSAAIAHSAVRTHHPATEGLVALLEPFIDTVIICTMTALVILTTVYEPSLASGGVQGVALTSAAFESTLSWSPPAVALAALLFAYSTMIAWSYYGLKGWTYLVGNSRVADLGFKLTFCAFVVLGCTLELDSVLELSDALIFIVAFPNVLGLYLLAPKIKETLDDYFD